MQPDFRDGAIGDGLAIGHLLHELPGGHGPSSLSAPAPSARLVHSCARSLPVRCLHVLAEPREPGRHRDGRRHWAQHSCRLHRTNLAGPGCVHGRRRVRKRSAGRTARRAVLAEHSAGERAHGAGRALLRTSLASPQRTLSGHRDTRRPASGGVGITHWSALTGGTEALVVPAPTLLGRRVNTDFRFYWIGVGAAGATALFTANLFRSRAGRAFVAIRDQDIAASAIGVDVFRYKLLASPFRLSSSGWREHLPHTIEVSSPGSDSPSKSAFSISP